MRPLQFLGNFQGLTHQDYLPVITPCNYCRPLEREENKAGFEPDLLAIVK